MNFHRTSSRLCVLAAFSTVTVIGHAAQPAPSSLLNLELPRYQSRGRPEIPRLNKNKLTIDALSPQAAPGARTARKSNLDYLIIDSHHEWSRPLRGSARDVTFVSFLAYGSDGTVFDIGGAQLQIKTSAKPGYARIDLGIPSSLEGSAPLFGGLVKMERHDSAALAALPVITVRVDPVAGSWDLYVFQRLVAADIPLLDTKGARQFKVTAGKEGASLCALVLSDENPLYVDANANGVDDAFERQKRGAVLGASTTPGERRELVSEWKAAQQEANVMPWRIQRPVPDDVAALR
jgi:hypothetical protein